MYSDWACCWLVRTCVCGGSTDLTWDSIVAIGTPGFAATSIWSSFPRSSKSPCAVARSKIESVSPASEVEFP